MGLPLLFAAIVFVATIVVMAVTVVYDHLHGLRAQIDELVWVLITPLGLATASFLLASLTCLTLFG